MEDKKNPLTTEEMETFRNLFDKYCAQEVQKGHCEPDSCEFCPIDNARAKIFDELADDGEEE